MAITASDIHNQSFSIDRKGYDVDEVDVFLEHVADEIDILNDTIAHLQDQLEADRFSGFDAPAASTVAITEVAAATVDTSSTTLSSLKGRYHRRSGAPAFRQARR
ncbi:MAG: DivIVA domain-containing protein [Adlercreutzia sp.]